MNIKSLLLGSAAALAAVSGAHAADAIVAAEPEPVEYVRVCDAYGTGYFYIPGTETCLQIGGYLRFEVGFGAGDAYKNNGADDWDAHTRAHVNFVAKSDTEYGVLTSAIVLESNFRPNAVGANTAMPLARLHGLPRSAVLRTAARPSTKPTSTSPASVLVSSPTGGMTTSRAKPTS